ncbi:MAG: hypothetical protein NVSMB4_11140 [Acidimicrobiales bacterium]
MPAALGVQRTVSLVAALVLAVWAGQALGREAPVPSPPAGATSSVGGATPTTTPATAPMATVPSAAAGSTSSRLAASVATSGPGLTEPGVHVVAQPDAVGDLEVMERVRLAKPVRRLAIARLHTAGSGVSATIPRVTGFQAEADGAVVTDSLASPLPEGGEWLALPAAATDIVMRYRLEGGVSRSQPAPVGRALIVLPPITAMSFELGPLPVVVEVVGAQVRNLVCPDLPVAEQLCGRQQGQVWTTTALPLGRSVVVAQVDLPAPGDR